MKPRTINQRFDYRQSAELEEKSILQAKVEKPLLGIDVSSYQGTIDWEAVAQADISFVFIKATEGGNYIDPTYLGNMKGARAAKVPCGAYHFFHPTIPVRTQVENFVRVVASLEPGDLQPVLDLEGAHDWSHVSSAKRIQMIEQWTSGVRDALNCETTLYMSSSFADEVFFGSAQLSKYALWVAHYTEDVAPWVPKPWHTWTFWQYTNRGRVEGIKTAVDLDLFNGTKDLLEKFRRQ